MTLRQVCEALRALDESTMVKFGNIIRLPFKDRPLAFRRLNEEYDAAEDAIIAVAIRSREKAARESAPNEVVLAESCNDARWGYERPFRAQSIKAHNEFRIGDSAIWTPDPLFLPFTPALDGQADQCPRLCGTVVDLDDLGQPFRVRVTALEGDWKVSPIGWRPEPGDVVVAHSVDRAGIMERVTEEVIDLDGVGDDILMSEQDG